MYFRPKNFGLAGLFLSICLPTFAQIASTKNARFQIEGTVSDPAHALVPGVEITFHSDNGTVTVNPDEKMAYHAELPLGTYSMTTRVPEGFRRYTRPLFRVDSPTRLVINIALQLGRNNCDIVVVGKDGQPATSEDWEEAAKQICGGQDSFPLPSKDGTPYEVLIQYPRRSQAAAGYDYGCDGTVGSCGVFVAYNLITIEADHVSYDVGHHRIKATGDVVLTSPSGKTNTGSLDLTLADGEAKPNR